MLNKKASLTIIFLEGHEIYENRRNRKNFFQANFFNFQLLDNFRKLFSYYLKELQLKKNGKIIKNIGFFLYLMN